MKKRTDKHAPKSFNPEDYTLVHSFAYPGTDGIGSGMEKLRAMQTGEPQPVYRYATTTWGFRFRTDEILRIETHEKVDFPMSRANCHHCGAHFRYGTVARHEPTGEHIIMGWICAERLDLTSTEWADIRADIARRTAAAREGRARIKAIRDAFEETPDLPRLLKVDHEITRDIRDRFRRSPLSCAPTTAQIELLKKLEGQVAEAKARTETERTVPAPEGRQVIEGTIIKIEEKWNAYGVREVMTVKVETPEGVWLAWGTMPRSLVADRGDEVRFTATLTRSDRSENFAFYKRPAKAEKLEAAAA